MTDHDHSTAIDVSIIIPIGPGDESWRDLLCDLVRLPFAAEIICVATQDRSDVCATNGVEWVVTTPGRAQQMNVGAKHARGRFLWFLHADSRVTADGIRSLQRQLGATPHALVYFNLRFAGDGPWLTKLNAWGVWWRSHLCGMPFGDQGLCLERSSFDSLGGYSEAAPYGEDHLLVWSARRRGIRLKCTGQSLTTSARKYRDRGWGRTTIRHLWLTLRQAWPQFCLWVCGR